jgi:hypothetical protein
MIRWRADAQHAQAVTESTRVERLRSHRRPRWRWARQTPTPTPTPTPSLSLTLTTDPSPSPYAKPDPDHNRNSYQVRSESYCVACHGGHRKHTCKRRLALGGDGGSGSGSTSGASGSGAGGDKASGKRCAGAESASSDGAGKAASETGCKACMGWHRGHTCGKTLRTAKDAD